MVGIEVLLFLLKDKQPIILLKIAASDDISTLLLPTIITGTLYIIHSVILSLNMDISIELSD